MEAENKYPEGHFLGIGIGFGIAIGMPFGLLFGIIIESIPIGIAVGPALGIGIGCGIGAALEARNRNKLRPLNEPEKRIRKIASGIGVVTLVIGLVIITYMLLIR